MSAALLALTLQACSTIQYYAQSVNGQMELLSARRPVVEVLEDPDTPQVLGQRLRVARHAREFAVRELGLPDNDSYTTYADLGRPYVVWNVVATPEFSLTPREWCFPVAGCLAYRGYFSHKGAQREAQGLRNEGLDVLVAGVPAYSTLGWFDDPLLNTMMHWEGYEVAGLIFHELAHQQLYVKGDTLFNESFAMLVEQEGMRRWMCSDSGSGRLAVSHYPHYRLQQRRQQAFIHLVLQTRERLETLYGQEMPAADMREEKRKIFARMRMEYARYRESQDDFGGYDEWMAQELNNAGVASVAMYHVWVPALRYLLWKHGGHLGDFYQAAGQLARQSQSQRDHELSLLLESAQKTEDVMYPPEVCKL